MSERLAKLARHELSPQQSVLYDAIIEGRRGTGSQPSNLVDGEGHLLGPFNAMLFAPEVGDALQQLGTAIRYGSSLSDRTRELVTLVVAAQWDSGFEQYAHEPLARMQGFTDSQLLSVRTGARVDDLSAEESAAIDVTYRLLDQRDLNDDEFESAVQEMGEQALVEITTLVGYYSLLALQLRLFRVAVPQGDVSVSAPNTPPSTQS
jgi:4-carboxymuconolactone decarboxylase